MKDITISSKQQKIELKWIAGCFCVAFLINVFSIIFYKTNWSEIYTQLLWILLIACILYAVSVGLRILIYLFNLKR